MELKIEFTDKEITPWGGMVLMKKLIEKTRMNEVLERLPLPTQNSNRGYNPIQLINNFWVSISSGIGSTLASASIVSTGLPLCRLSLSIDMNASTTPKSGYSICESWKRL